MTLREAFKKWSEVPRNVTLAQRSRTAVNNVLLKKHGERDLVEFDAMLTDRIMSESNQAKETKVKAAAILVYLLEWGAEHRYCKKPKFGYEIASGELQKPEEPEPVPEAAQPKPVVKKRRGGRRKETCKEVVQLNQDTLEEVARYPSCADAARELGKKEATLTRQARCFGGAYGYYWVYTEDLKKGITYLASRKQVLKANRIALMEVEKKASRKTAARTKRTSADNPEKKDVGNPDNKDVGILQAIRELIAINESFGAGSSKLEFEVEGFKVIIEVRRKAA